MSRHGSENEDEPEDEPLSARSTHGPSFELLRIQGSTVRGEAGGAPAFGVGQARRRRRWWCGVFDDEPRLRPIGQYLEREDAEAGIALERRHQLVDERGQLEPEMLEREIPLAIPVGVRNDPEPAPARRAHAAKSCRLWALRAEDTLEFLTEEA